MQKFIVVGALLVSFICVPASTFAASSLDTLTPNTLYEKFLNTVNNDYKTYQQDTYVSVDVFEDLEALENEDYTVSSVAEMGGFYREIKTNPSKFEWDQTATITVDALDTSESYTIHTIGKDGAVYVNFPVTEQTKLRTVWGKLSKDEYTTFGDLAGLPEVFQLGLVSAEDINLTEEMLKMQLAKKHNLYKYASFPVDSGITVSGAKRYDLEFNPNALHDYYSDLKKNLPNGSETGFSVSKEFLKALEYDEYAEDMADNSYLSMWFDKKTGLPRRIVFYIAVPGINDGDPYVVVRYNALWSDINKDKTITLPTKTLGMNTLAETFDVALPSAEEQYREAIEQSKAELKVTKKKAEKATLYFYIGQWYMDLGDKKQAAANFKKAASFYKKNSSYAYLALAQAAAAEGDTKKVRENYEKGLAANPKDELFLGWYVWFLMGLSNDVTDGQDLQKALEINVLLNKQNVDDFKLANLYATYLMLGIQADADALKGKFENFESDEVSVVIARAYHRMGDVKNTEKFMKQAVEAGYEESLNDTRFFADTYKK